MKRIAVGVAAGILILSGCGSVVDENGNADGYVEVGELTVDNRPLNCVFYAAPGDASREVNGISCDWISYHGLNNPDEVTP